MFIVTGKSEFISYYFFNRHNVHNIITINYE